MDRRDLRHPAEGPDRAFAGQSRRPGTQGGKNPCRARARKIRHPRIGWRPIRAATRRFLAERRLFSCARPAWVFRSEEHTSELQSLTNLVCRLLLEKKKKN